MKPLPKIEPYVTHRGGVVILNGPFPLAEAERIRALCEAAPDLLKVCKEIHNYFMGTGGDPLNVGQRVDAAIEKAEGRS
ncbi:MAG: hypothetical protein MUO24_02340 [Desulfobacterales bacterium]|nr:hypothetical protein [Desulfobacterales bacterium]